MVPKSNIVANNDIAVAYLRVSTSRQKEEGSSLGDQEKAVWEYAEKNNFILLESNIYKESRPASKIYTYKHEKIIDEIFDERKELRKILERVPKHEFGHLIVHSRDRLTRDKEHADEIEELLRDNGVVLHFSKPGEHILINDEKISNFISSILYSVGQYEANTIGSRVKLGSKQCARDGSWPGGRSPYGYETTSILGKDKSKQLKKMPFEEKIVREIFIYYNYFGYGYRKIAETLNMRYMGKTWTKSSVEAIIKNETYTGSIVWNRRGGRRRPGKHEENEIIRSSCKEKNVIINKNTWKQTTTLRSKKTEIKDPNYYSTPYILKGKLICGICGNSLVPKNRGKDKVYKCPKTNEYNVSEMILKKEHAETIFIQHLIDIIKVKDIDTLWSHYNKEVKKEVENTTASIEDLKIRLSDLNEKQKQVEDLYRNLNHPQKASNEKAEEYFETNLKDQLGELDIVLRKKTEIYSILIQQQEEYSESFITSKEKFEEAFNNVLIKFDQLNNTPKRMIVEYLVGKIIVDKNAYDQIQMDIIIDPPKVLS